MGEWNDIENDYFVIEDPDDKILELNIAFDDTPVKKIFMMEITTLKGETFMWGDKNPPKECIQNIAIK